jgi:hypothetical protein
MKEFLHCNLSEFKPKMFKGSGNYLIICNDIVVYSGESNKVGVRVSGHRTLLKSQVSDHSTPKLKQLFQEHGIDSFSVLLFNQGADIICRMEVEDFIHTIYIESLLSTTKRQLNKYTKQEIALAKLKRMENQDE